MESALELKNSERKNKLEWWISTQCGLSPFFLETMVGDASFRRYFRVKTNTGSWVAMDAEPPRENCRPYVAIARAIRSMGLHAPEIVQSDLEHGFLLITDFGNNTYLNTLNENNADQLYTRALDVLSVLQRCQHVEGQTLLPFTREFMWQEWAWHKEWFLDKLLGLNFSEAESQLDRCYMLLIDAASTQPQVFMHRDYHSANLMVLPDTEVGILDFQDAFIGPITYDPVSLLRDCYIHWPEQQVRKWALTYFEKLTAKNILQNVQAQAFLYWFDLMGMQRHLKALLTFARKKVRDHQSQYLQYVPRTLMYLQRVSEQYPEFAFLHDYLTHEVQPAFNRVIPSCER